MKPSSPKRLDLQGLRAWAMVAVVVFHFFPSLLPIGYLGVDVFFVLSGFLISLVLSKSPANFSTYTSFYFKRIRRIFPLLLLIVAVLVVYIVAHYEDKLLFYNSRSAVFALFFLTNIRAQDKGEDYFRSLEQSTDLFTHTWSLAVEVQFYLLAPLLIHLSKHFIGTRTTFYLPFLSMISSLSLVYHGSSSSGVAFNSTLARLWQFLAGAAVLHIQDSWTEWTRVSTTGDESKECLLDAEEQGDQAENGPLRSLSISTLSYGLSFAFLAAAFIVLREEYNLVLLTRVGVTYATALLMLAQLQTPLLTNSLVVEVGNASYALYLVHWPVVCILAEYQITATWAKIVTILLCFAVSFVIERYYEAWYLRLNESSTLLLVFALYSLCFGCLVAREFTIGEGGVPDLYPLPGELLNASSSLNTAPPSVVPSTVDVLAQLEKEWEKEMTRNISLAEALAQNEKFENAWAQNLIVANCTMRKKEDNPWGLCDMPPGKGKLKFLVVVEVGNCTMMNPSSPQRADLQGLRAWAVVAVVVFHFFPSLLPIGYLGVDVFFVLSGFLISLVLSKAATAFSTYTSFYFKRIRRIFPLLLLIVLVLVVYIVLHYEAALLFYNSRSAVFALLFITNIRAQDKGEDYFRSLEQSTDLFTHTWSLAVEVQFYLLAPLLIHLSKFCIGCRATLHLPFLSLLSSLSLLYHGFSASGVAFNSTLARLWQFLAGAIVVHIQDSWNEWTPLPTTGEDFKNCLLDAEEQGEQMDKGIPQSRTISILAYALSLAFLAVAFLALWKEYNMVFLARVGVTYGSALLIFAQLQSPLLTNSMIVRIGDASYALYLVHWPVVCILAENQITAVWAKIAAILICFAVSFAIERFYEAWYRHLNESSTFILVFALYSLCFGCLVVREFTVGEGGVPDLYTSSFLCTPASSVAQLEKEWEKEMTRNISLAQAMALNEKFDNDWARNLIVTNCKMRKETVLNPWGLCDMSPGKGALKFLVVGNRYTANHVELVHRHFAPFYSTFQQHSVATCETLLETPEKVCTGNAKLMEEDVMSEKPDVLFVIQRWTVLTTPIKDVNNLDSDAQFTEILQRVDRIGRNVSKVFVMHTLPRSIDVRKAIKTRVDKKQEIPDAMPEAIDADDKWMRLRLEGIAKRCRNCVLFDLKKRHLNAKGEYTVSQFVRLKRESVARRKLRKR